MNSSNKIINGFVLGILIFFVVFSTVSVDVKLTRYKLLAMETTVILLFAAWMFKVIAEKKLIHTALSLIPNQNIKDEIHRLLTSRENEAIKDGIEKKLGSMVKIGGWIEEKAGKEGLGKAIPSKHKKVDRIGETLEVLLND